MDFGDDCTVGYKVGFPPCWFHPWIFKKSHKKRHAGSRGYATLLADYHISKGMLIGFSLWRDTMKSSFLWILFDSCINLEKRPVPKSFQFTTFEKAHLLIYFFWCSTNTKDSSFFIFLLPFPPPPCLPPFSASALCWCAMWATEPQSCCARPLSPLGRMVEANGGEPMENDEKGM